MNISCSPSNAFDIKANSVSLKEYPDDLLMYFSGTDTSLKLTKAEGLAAPYSPTEPDEYHVKVKQDETGFPYTFVDRDYTLTYYKNNFRNFNKGTIRVNVKKENCDGDYAYQDFSGFKGVSPGSYVIYFSLIRNAGVLQYSLYFTVSNLIDSDNLAELSALINRTSNESTGSYNVLTTTVVDNDTLRFRTKADSGLAVIGYLKAADSGNEESLNTWFTTQHKSSYYSVPFFNTKILSFHEQDSTNNEISLWHRRDGYLWLYMYDENSEYSFAKKVCPWDWSNETFKEIEVNFDSSLSNVIVGGDVKVFFETVGVDKTGTKYDTIIRSDSQNVYLTLGGGGDAYGFREIDVFNAKQHCGNYTVPASVVAYDGTAYTEYQVGELDVFDDATLEIEGDGKFLFQAFDDGVPLSYVDKSGNTVVVESTDADDFISKFKGLDYDTDSTIAFQPSDLVFKVTYLDKTSKITKFKFDPGTSVYDDNDQYNFEDLYNWVRRQLGAPQITCELTDDQIYDALCKAVNKYNKYRNWNENLNIYDLDGADPEDTTILRKGHSEREGNYYILPSHISDKDIVDIFFQPRFSTCWFGAGDSFLNNVMSQTFFGLYGGIVQNSADYYIHRISCNDISNIIGTQVSWRVYNHHLYITPNNLHDLDQFKVGIKFRPSLTVEEIRNSEDIKSLTLAYAMRTLGLIRGSFGGSIQAGDIAIQLNSETLLAEAKDLEEKTLALLKSEQKPLWMIWT